MAFTTVGYCLQLCFVKADVWAHTSAVKRFSCETQTLRNPPTHRVGTAAVALWHQVKLEGDAWYGFQQRLELFAHVLQRLQRNS